MTDTVLIAIIGAAGLALGGLFTLLGVKLALADRV